MATDPVCGMAVTPAVAKKKKLVLTKEGTTHYFCSKRCLDAFKKPKRVELKASISYTCPMHPNVHSKHEGLCPECGMKLVPEKQSTAHETYDKHEGHSTNIFKRRFWVSLLLTIPIVAYSDLATMLGITLPSLPYLHYIILALSTIIFLYGGSAFIIGGYRELRARVPGMMTLIALAITVAYGYSVYATFFGGGTLFWELATLITIMLLGHWIEMRAVTGSQRALHELAQLLPDKAEVIRGKETVTVTLDQLREGDLVLVRPGGKIPADGVVIEGTSDVNEALITGESKPVTKTAESNVVAGSTNGDGSLTVKVTSIGEKTFLAGIMRLVQEAQASKSKLQTLADKAAFALTLIAVGTGALTLAAWLYVSNISFALERVVAVLVIACPHALGLAIPLVASISTTLSARNGILVRQRLALEAARNIQVVVFDKTGTLTKGSYGVTAIIPLDSDEKDMLQLAASVDNQSEHVVAKAVVEEAKKRGIELLSVTHFKRLPGKGVAGTVKKHEVVVGPLDSIPAEAKTYADQGQTVIGVTVNKKLQGVIALADQIRDESREAVAALQKQGVQVAMLTGDSEDVAGWVAKELGIDKTFARVTPDQKAAKIKVLQSEGKKVAMVGDGINDAPALTQADVGIAIGAGTTVAIESAGIILVRNDPRDIVKIINLSRATYRKMVQNLFWATGYNVVAIPLAAGVLASQGILLDPALGAVFMSLSTVIVAANAALLKRLKL